MPPLPPPWDLFYATVEGRESTMSAALHDGLPVLSFEPIFKGSAPNLAMLASYIRSEHPIPAEVRGWLADMLDPSAASESVLRLQIERRAPGRPPMALDRHWDTVIFYEEMCKTTHPKAAFDATLAQFGIKRSRLRAAIADYRDARETAARVQREDGPI